MTKQTAIEAVVTLITVAALIACANSWGLARLS